MNILVIGASRGIGLEFVRQYRADKAQVTATARSDEGLKALRELGATALQLDVASTESASRLGWQIEGAAFDVAIVVAGVYGPSTRGLQPPTEADFDTVMHTNVLGPMRVIPQIADALAPGAKLAVLSSRMGAIGPRSSASGWLYRASKAAVNSVLKDASIVLQDKATCVSFHPGWVRTDMGGAGADLAVDVSVGHMRRVIAGLTPSDNGQFFDHDGTPIAW
ncbi:SDR family oxidoreductase [Piscinibacter gummiphilus]|uniref:SDR family oxidoreductase n=1 Tax=Piscinibacter gummiphilus TaxID=946333 RepID=A0ABZ0CX36_9BURK|nr:SDR family oxidoreductase [Piscinibacter gummiphilus]WOB09081.1 SDR family oxidoreductase [Piscinibacter gummiphilus]